MLSYTQFLTNGVHILAVELVVRMKNCVCNLNRNGSMHVEETTVMIRRACGNITAYFHVVDTHHGRKIVDKQMLVACLANNTFDFHRPKNICMPQHARGGSGTC